MLLTGRSASSSSMSESGKPTMFCASSPPSTTNSPEIFRPISRSSEFGALRTARRPSSGSTSRVSATGRLRLPYSGCVTTAHDYSDLHELIDQLEPEQADELREHALRLVTPTRDRF